MPKVTKVSELREAIAYWEQRKRRTTDPEDLDYIRERQDARKAELVKLLSLSKAERDKVEARFSEEAEQEAYASAEEKAEEELPEQFNPFDPLGLFKRR